MYDRLIDLITPFANIKYIILEPQDTSVKCRFRVYREAGL